MNEEEILDYDENIYQKLARATARAVDINLGKTTLADLLDGYTKSEVLQKENNQLKEEYKKVRDELLQYEIQNSKLQKELVELRVNTGRNVILGGKENDNNRE